MTHLLYEKGILDSETTVFAITQKGTHYQILSLWERTCEDEERYSAHSEYANSRAWYAEDEREFIQSHTPHIMINPKWLLDYLRGQRIEEVEYLLGHYKFDSEIVEFLVICAIDGYVYYEEGYSLIMTRINKEGLKDICLSSLNDATVTTIPELNWSKNMSILAGRSINYTQGGCYLISLDKKYLSKDGFAQTAYVREQQKEDEVRVAIMSKSEYKNKHRERCDSFELANIPQGEMLPRLGLLVWEREDDGVRLKAIPKYFFVDLTNPANIKNESDEDEREDANFPF